LSTKTETAPKVDEPADTAEPAAEPAAPIEPEATGTPEAGETKKRGRKTSAARKTRTVELLLTLTGTAEGEWQAELSQSGRRVLQGVPIPAASVSRAAAELHEDIAKAIEEVIDSARQQHQARLEELEAELNRVRQALADLQES
jgi:polyhydroxyalkanoate synthesis regulator phasin